MVFGYKSLAADCKSPFFLYNAVGRGCVDLKRRLAAWLLLIALTLPLPSPALAAWDADGAELPPTDAPAFSAPDAEPSEPASDCFVFQLTDGTDAAEIAELSGAELLCEDARLYRTDDPGLLRRLEAENLLAQYAPDGTVYLDELSEDIEALSAQDYRSAMLGYDYAEANQITGSGVRVAVIDSGLWSGFSAHSSADILPGVNCLVEEGSPKRSSVEDTYGHGTFVASVICGDDIGLAPGVSLLPLKCFDGNTSKYSYLIEAISIAIRENCDVINLSLGSAERYPPLEEAVQSALDRGIIVIASSGNTELASGSTGDDAPMYPAAQEGVISVGAVDKTKTVWKKSIQNSSVCVVAPGVSVSGLSIKTGALYTSNGTSFAAPVVTATAALALSADPELTSGDFTELLCSTAEDLGDAGRDHAYGYGLVNPALLLATLRQDTESLILTGWDGKVGISAYLAAQDVRNLLAFYDENGKMLSVEPKDRLCCLPIPDTAKRFALFSVGAENCLPLRCARELR